MIKLKQLLAEAFKEGQLGSVTEEWQPDPLNKMSRDAHALSKTARDDETGKVHVKALAAHKEALATHKEALSKVDPRHKRFHELEIRDHENQIKRHTQMAKGFGLLKEKWADEWTSNKQDGREISAKENIMRKEGGMLKPGKQAMSKHNYNKPKVVGVEESEVNESPSEYTANDELSNSSVPSRKVRLKNKKTGATVGIFADFKAATKAHNEHPDKRNLHVESAQQAVINNVLDNLEELPEASVVESMSFSDYSQHFDAIAEQIDKELAEKQLLLDKKKKVINDIELDERDGREDDEGYARTKKEDDAWNKRNAQQQRPLPVKKVDPWKKKAGVDESAFDWKKPSEPRYDWSKLDKDANKKFEDDTEDGVVKHKAGQKPKKDPNAVKKAVGRPAGEYMGGYKLKGGSDRGAKIGAKVHTPERAANYKEMIDSRNHFKEVMNAAIKKRQSELA